MRFALVAIALTLLASACGSKHGSSSSTTTGSAAPNVQAAVEKTVKAGSEHLQLLAASKAAGQNVTIAGGGDFDAAKRIGALDVTVGLSALNAQLNEVLDGSVVYVSAPSLFSAFLPAGKKWLRIDLATAGKALGLSTAVLAVQDPTSALGQLKAITGLTEIGTATIGGVATTHFRGTIDAAKLPADERSTLAKTGTTFGAYDVWVGSDGYVHKVRVVTTTKGARTTATVTLSKFGEGVIVSVPPASETVDASKLSIPGLSG